MAKKKTALDRFCDLSWNELEEWAGWKIVNRGKTYQRDGRVTDLALTDDFGLAAWVDGTERYATKVKMNEDGLPESICTCPYEFDCKHGVAVVIEYLEWIEKGKQIPRIRKGNERLRQLENREYDDGDEASEVTKRDIESLLKGKSKTQLVELVVELAEKHPDLSEDLCDRRQLILGNTETIVARLRSQIRDIAQEPGWQDYWHGKGYTPDYSGIRHKLETLVQSGHADEVVGLGEELVSASFCQIEQSRDDGETAMEIASCMPVIVEALDRSTLDATDKLNWALDAVLDDQFDVYEAFYEYLHRRHPRSAWNELSDRLLERLSKLKGIENFSRRFERDRITDWITHALERAGRSAEIIPLCEKEARKTGSYDRLVKRLVEEGRYEDAERWIKEGVRDIGEKWPGIATSLRSRLREIRSLEKSWQVVAVMQVEEFVRQPSRQVHTDCEAAARKINAWPKVREHLLRFLEGGELPWRQMEWTLPETGLEPPEGGPSDRFPLIDELVDIAILEGQADQVLKWYDQRPADQFGWSSVNEDGVAAAIQEHAPDRAVAIWKNKAERLIAKVNPSAYQEAAKYLRKAARVMNREQKLAEWNTYLKELRSKHLRKRRLIEILDDLWGKRLIYDN